jgi:hypothetical protein
MASEEDRMSMTADEQWVLNTVLTASLQYRKLCVAWAIERGTRGNVVVWPKRVIEQALNKLIELGMITLEEPGQRNGR